LVLRRQTSSESSCDDVIIDNDEWEISRECLHLEHVLGRGAFGVVRKAVLSLKCLHSGKGHVEQSSLDSEGTPEDGCSTHSVAVKMLCGMNVCIVYQMIINSHYLKHGILEYITVVGFTINDYVAY